MPTTKSSNKNIGLYINSIAKSQDVILHLNKERVYIFFPFAFTI
jgi:hypothetical protein